MVAMSSLRTVKSETDRYPHYMTFCDNSPRPSPSLSSVKSNTKTEENIFMSTWSSMLGMIPEMQDFSTGTESIQTSSLSEVVSQAPTLNASTLMSPRTVMSPNGPRMPTSPSRRATPPPATQPSSPPRLERRQGSSFVPNYPETTSSIWNESSTFLTDTFSGTLPSMSHLTVPSLSMSAQSCSNGSETTLGTLSLW